MGDTRSPLQILYLEDDPLDVEPVDDRLQQTGFDYELTVASDRQEFEAAVAKTHFDLVLADYLLPSYDGMTALAHVRESRPDVPFILISGVLGEEQAVDCVLAGATDYVLKHHLERLVFATQRAMREVGERQRRRRAEEALRASEEQYRNIFETASEGIWVVDRDGVTVLSNARLEALLGCRREELVGRRLEECFEAPCPVLEEELRWFGAPDPATASSEFEFRNKAGTQVSVIVSKSALRDAEGCPDGGVMMFTDVTERKLIEAERAKLRRQLQRANRMESLGALAGGVAHDINNVLAAVLGVASLNLRLQPPESRAYRDFQTISKAAVRGSEMVRRMLGFARATPERKCRVDVNGLIREIVSLLERTTLSRIRIETDLTPDLHAVHGDPAAITQAVMNLCVNAADAIEDAGVLRLRTLNHGDGSTGIQVEDSGAGMSREVLDNVLDPFFTTKEQGTGIGLSIVQRIMQSHLGIMEIESTPGQGTTVHLRFPASGRSATHETVAAPSAADGVVVSKQVLVVDDDDSCRATLVQLLEWLGHSVSIAVSGEDALKQLRGGCEPDLVLLDMNMPGMSGVQTLRAIREWNRSVPVVITTGLVDDNVRALAESEPRVGLLAKPFTIDSVQSHIEMFAGRERD